MGRLRPAIRSRLTLGRIVFAVALVAGFLAADALLEKDAEGAPADHSASLVPAEALAYVHVSVDRDSEQWRNANSVARRLPRLISLRDRLLRRLTVRGGRIDLEREVFPWLDDEAALALLADDRGTARSLILLEVSDPDLARSFLSRAVGRVRRSAYRGTPIRLHGSLATAFLDGFLVIGQLDNVRAAIAVRETRRGSLDRSPSFRRARAALPDTERLLYAYATRDGIARVLRPRPGIVGRLAKLADDPALVGAAAGLRAEEGGMRIDVGEALSRALSRRSVRQRVQQRFVPQLLDAIPGNVIAYFSMRGADGLFESITSAIGGTLFRLPPSLGSLRSDLSGAGGAGVRRALRPLLSKETALLVTRSRSGPVLTLVVNGVDKRQGGRLLQRLQPQLGRLLERPAAGQVPTFRPTRIAGLDAVTLTISPSIELTYSVFGGRAVVSTSPEGIRKMKTAKSRLKDNRLFRSNLQSGLQRVTSVLFLDLEQLLALGDQAGLSDAPSYRAFGATLSQVSAVSAVTSNTAAGKKAAIFIEVP